MKKTIVATLLSAILAVAVLVIGCNEASVTTAPPAASPSPMGTGVDLTDEAILRQIQSSIQLAICISTAEGSAVPEEMFDLSRTVEEARQALCDLEGQRAGIAMLINTCLETGQPVPNDQYAKLQSIDEERQTVLKRIGFAD